jgi:hypothetical protein
MSNILLSIEDVNYVRETLAAVHICLHAQDIADSARAGREGVRSSTLAREVAACLEQVNQSYSDYLLAEEDRQRYSLDDGLDGYTEDDEDLEPLDEDDE